MIDVELLNLPERTAILTDGSAVPITNLFDAAGAETDDPSEAVSFVCGAGSCWISDRIDSFQQATIH